MVRSLLIFCAFATGILLRPSLSMAALPAVGSPMGPICLQRFNALGKMDVEMKSPGYARLLSGRIYDRLERTQPASFRAVTEAIARPANGKKHSIAYTDLSAAVTTAVTNGVLSVSVAHVKINDSAKAVKGKVGKLSFGAANPSLNMGFPRFLVAIADGIEAQLASNPSIREVSITGKFVVNGRLIKELKDLGFEAGVPGAMTLLTNTMRHEGGFTHLLFGVLGFLHALPADHMTEVKVVAGAIKTVAAVRHKDYSRDWKLVFKVKPESETIAPAAD